jgi:predicted phage terminase large subunit-like protein
MSTTKKLLTEAEFRAILRNDFYTFAKRAFLELNPQVLFIENLYIEFVAAALEACRRGKIRRLIINLPPRSLKSHLASIAFPAFLLGHDPSAEIICASYGQSLADKLSLDCRNLMNSRFYRRTFPTRLAPYKQSLQEFATSQKGSRLATSVQGVLTGRGAGYLILDDVLRPDEALSESQRKAVNDWYDHTLYSRLNNKQTGCIIIMQRLHEDDLVGHVLEQEDWEVLRLPAIAEEDEAYEIESIFGSKIFYRVAGEVLDPIREPLHVLDRIRKSIGSYNFAGQYQQSPSPLGGGMVKQEWFQRYTPGAEPRKFDLVIQSWDTANKDTELADPSVCTTWGKRGNRIYLLNVYCRRVDYPDLKRAIKEQRARFPPDVILIEDKASGTQLVQELIREGVYGVTRYVPKDHKIMRLHSVTSVIENGYVYLPTEASWLDSYLREMLTFPKGKNDDQVDSTSQALDWIKQGNHAFGVYQYQNKLARELGISIPRSSEEEATDLSSIICPNCETIGVAQHGRQFYCYTCQHRWEPSKPSNEPITCKGPNGQNLEWDHEIELWVDPMTGATFKPATEED